MGIRLNRHLGPVRSLRCGEFTVNDEESGFRPVLSCPLCSEVFVLPAHCRVEADGRVVPAVKCASPTCSFFEYLSLESIWEAVLI